VIVLEDIHDPHNAAAVWRSCDGFGFQKVYLIFDQEKGFNPKKIGKASSSSANKWLDFKVFKSTKACLKALKNEGYKIFATVLDKEAVDIKNIKFNNLKIAILLGNEHRGLSETAIKLADEKIYIPMKGMVQSFNLSVTAAIVMYEVGRQRTKGKNIYGLSKEEKKEIGKRWR
jgi:tRNA (guanosine-2'-O-)-methyltransferase